MDKMDKYNKLIGRVKNENGIIRGYIKNAALCEEESDELLNNLKKIVNSSNENNNKKEQTKHVLYSFFKSLKETKEEYAQLLVNLGLSEFVYPDVFKNGLRDYESYSLLELQKEIGLINSSIDFGQHSDNITEKYFPFKNISLSEISIKKPMINYNDVKEKSKKALNFFDLNFVKLEKNDENNYKLYFSLKNEGVLKNLSNTYCDIVLDDNTDIEDLEIIIRNSIIKEMKYFDGVYNWTETFKNSSKEAILAIGYGTFLDLCEIQNIYKNLAEEKEKTRN